MTFGARPAPPKPTCERTKMFHRVCAGNALASVRRLSVLVNGLSVSVKKAETHSRISFAARSFFVPHSSGLGWVFAWLSPIPCCMCHLSGYCPPRTTEANVIRERTKMFQVPRVRWIERVGVGPIVPLMLNCRFWSMGCRFRSRIPAFSRYVKKSRTVEAFGHLNKIYQGAVTYYETHSGILSGRRSMSRRNDGLAELINRHPWSGTLIAIFIGGAGFLSFNSPLAAVSDFKAKDFFKCRCWLAWFVAKIPRDGVMHYLRGSLSGAAFCHTADSGHATGKRPRFALMGTVVIAATLSFLKIVTDPLPAVAAVGYGVPIGLAHGLPFLTWDWARRKLGNGFSTMVFPVALVLTEWSMHGLLPMGTWGAMVNSQLDQLALLQLASVTGPHGVSFLMALVAAVGERALAGERRTLKRTALTTVALVFFVMTFGQLRLTWHKGPDNPPAGSLRWEPTVRLGQNPSCFARRKPPRRSGPGRAY